MPTVTNSSASPPPHLVLVVFRDAGHIGPSMVLAKRLAALGVRLTLLFPEWDGYTRAKAEPGLFQISTLKPLVDQDGHLEEWAKPAALEAALEELKQQEEPPTAVLVDMIYVHWSMEPISKAKLPRYLFYTSGGTSLAFMLELHGSPPPPPPESDEIGAANGQIEDAHHSNGVGNGAHSDRGGGVGNGAHSDGGVGDGVRSNGVGDGNGHLHSNGHRHEGGGRGRGRGRGGRGGFHRPGGPDHQEKLRRSAGILVNTAYELEAKELDLIQTVVTVYPVGPLFSFDPESTPSRDSPSDECLQWLDSQPPGSVAFISFGSRTYLSGEQIRELATGLEASGQRFLWVLPTQPDQPSLVDESLPDGFLDRVAGRGYLLRGWAPQLAILAHPSTGGFVTHCGWNSVAETICLAAQPMLCWPFDADQPTNAKFLVEDAQVALRLNTGAGGGAGRRGPRSVVRHDEIEQQVRALVAGPETTNMRKRLAAMQAATLAAIKPKGSSQVSLAKFVEDLVLA